MVRPLKKDRTMVRTELIAMRVRIDQRRQWEAKAKRLGLTMSKWLRMLADRDARM
jgi:antitoxin component of RelBE/YafQ-DinJ toxin-antitoxin module